MMFQKFGLLGHPTPCVGAWSTTKIYQLVISLHAKFTSCSHNGQSMEITGVKLGAGAPSSQVLGRV